MHAMNADLTIVLPLWDRASYSLTWCKENLQPTINYIIADGSKTNANELIFGPLCDRGNISYIRYPHDLRIEDYVAKVADAVSRATTPFIMTCDNDDFINFRGVAKCLTELRQDAVAVCAGGAIYGVTQVDSTSVQPRYTLPVWISDGAALNGMSGFDGLVRMFKNYRYPWYSVFRTDAYQKIWRDMDLLRISNIYLVELLHAQLTLCHGKYIHVATNHYIRLGNPTSNCANDFALKMTPHTHQIYFDDDYRSQVLRMSAHVAKLLDIELPQLLDELKNYYILGGAHTKMSFLELQKSRLLRLHEIAARKLSFSFPIVSGIALINAYYGARGALKA